MSDSNIEESRKKLSKKIKELRSLELDLADTRAKIASIKKKVDTARRSREEVTSISKPTRGKDRKGAGDEIAGGPDPDKTELERLIIVESRLAEYLEIATENLEALLDNFSSANSSESAELLSSDIPILLFPVRLETKFYIDGQGARQLLIRIYPDKIAAQTHEDGLTEDEIEAGKRYWVTIQHKDRSDSETKKKKHKEAWGILTSRYGQYRSAWIVHRVGKALKNNESMKPKPASWTRPPLTNIMPDRWVAITYVGEEETHRVFGNPILPSIQVGIDPLSQKEEDIGAESELKVDEGIKWMVDFAAAETKGMGIKISLTPAEEESGFTRIVVVGLKYSMDENESTRLVEALFESHHYTHGLAFSPQGTPTNNASADKRSGFIGSDYEHKNSFDVEVSAPLYDKNEDLDKAKDGKRAAIALGLKPDFFIHIENSDLSEHQDAKQMGIALWPIPGYYLEELMKPNLNVEDIILGRRFFVDNIRGRGPFSALRVGNTPYGILPASSLKRWMPREEDDRIEAFLPNFLKNMYIYWEKPILDRKVPFVGCSNDPDQELLNILGINPTSLDFYARLFVGYDVMENLFTLLGKSKAIRKKWWDIHDDIAGYFLNTMGYANGPMPRIVSMTSVGRYSKILLDTVHQLPLSETEPLPKDRNYIKWLSTATLDEIKKKATFIEGNPDYLLYILLHYSILREYVSTSFRTLKKRGMISQDEERTRDPEVIIGTATHNDDDFAHTVFSGLKKIVRDLSSNQTLEKYLDGIKTMQDVPDDEENLKELAELRESLAYLTDVPTAKLERLMSETLDIFSHRLDAWISGLYTARLNKMRKTRKEGIYIGGYGWVENLHPSYNRKQPAEEAADLPNHTRIALSLNERGRERTLPKPVVSSTNGGFIHAPSLLQAATAAVLRNASLSHRTDQEGDKAQFEINLSSERVKYSLWLLEGIRNGQSLAVLLGYRFERGLHENPYRLELDQYIQPLRDFFPLNPKESQNQPVPTNINPQERIQARDVVNGLEMLKAWRKGTFPFVNLNIRNPDEERAIKNELQALDNTVDAISDLTLAESVFQMVQGNYSGLAANLDAYSHGERPPEQAIARTPRSGVRLTHRVMVVLFEDRLDDANIWDRSTINNPRAKAEPNLNRWLAKLLGNPSKIVCKVKYKTSSSLGSLSPNKTRHVTLADLKLCPLDFLELSHTSAAEQHQSEIDARVSYFILSKNPNRTNLEIIYAVTADDLESDEISFADALEFARMLRRFVSSSRGINPEDLLLPEETLEETDSIRLSKEIEAELVGRAKKIESKLESEIRSLKAASTEGTRLKALIDASLFGVLGAFPDNHVIMPAKDYHEYLKRRVVIVKNELEKRLHKARELKYKNDGKGDYQPKIAIANAKISEIFGSSFPVLPKFTLSSSRSRELNNSLNNSVKLLDGDEDAPLPWFQQAAKVRPVLSYYESVISFAEALKTDTLGFKIAQIPFNVDERWIALSFDNSTEKNKPVSGKVSLVISSYGQTDFGKKISGLIIDEWPEIIPDDNETTGVAFHYDIPNSEAPQALLLAIPYDNGPTWKLEDIIATVNETLDLAKVRAVDLAMVGAAAQFLPALYFTSTPTKDSSIKRNAIIDADLEGNNELKLRFLRTTGDS